MNIPPRLTSTLKNAYQSITKVGIHPTGIGQREYDIARDGGKLEKAKADLVKQETTVNEMQNSLTELKGTIERDNRTIKRLKRQRNLSQVIGAGAIIGIAISR